MRCDHHPVRSAFHHTKLEGGRAHTLLADVAVILCLQSPRVEYSTQPNVGAEFVARSICARSACVAPHHPMHENSPSNEKYCRATDTRGQTLVCQHAVLTQRTCVARTRISSVIACHTRLIYLTSRMKAESECKRSSGGLEHLCAAFEIHSFD